VKTDWSVLETELALWRRAGLSLPLWWRDDDAVAPSPALEQLTEMASALGLSAHLAVIPKHAKPDLADFCAGTDLLVPVVHGWSHENHAAEGQKKSEFGQSRNAALAEAAAGLARMDDLFGTEMLPIFVPPWNRIAPEVIAGLPSLGYIGLSTYTPRPAREVIAGLVQINTHIDPINWRGGGGLRSPEAVLAELVNTLKDRRKGATDLSEPLGFLSHHLVHDAAIWDFTQGCLSALLDGGAEPCNMMTLKGNLP
jgi:hypothetical protein